MKQVAIAAAAAAIGIALVSVALVYGGKAEALSAPEASPAPPPKEPTIDPPAQLPEVEIPLIPPVDETDPFKPGEYRPAPKAGPGPLAEGKHLFDREGRLALDEEGHPIFVFDSGDEPMRLLESANREYLENATAQGAKHARWRVSGLVTLYHGRNYLLLLKVVRIMPEEEGL